VIRTPSGGSCASAAADRIVMKDAGLVTGFTGSVKLPT
jgi:hypothetical protein